MRTRTSRATPNGRWRSCAAHKLVLFLDFETNEKRALTLSIHRRQVCESCRTLGSSKSKPRRMTVHGIQYSSSGLKFAALRGTGHRSFGKHDVQRCTSASWHSSRARESSGGGYGNLIRFIERIRHADPDSFSNFLQHKKARPVTRETILIVIESPCTPENSKTQPWSREIDGL